MENLDFCVKFRKKRRRRHYDSEDCLPIFYGIIGSKRDNWSYYSGVFDGSTVKVYHSGDIHDLYNMGCFGKGALSRSRPSHAHTCPVIPPPMSDLQPLRVIHRNKYIKHLNWRNQSISDKGDYTEIPDYYSETETGNENCETVVEIDNTMEMDRLPNETQLPGFDSVEPSAVTMESVDADENCSKIIDRKISEWDKMEADENFWSSDIAPNLPGDIQNAEDNVSNVIDVISDRNQVQNQEPQSPDSKFDSLVSTFQYDQLDLTRQYNGSDQSNSAVVNNQSDVASAFSELAQESTNELIQSKSHFMSAEPIKMCVLSRENHENVIINDVKSNFTEIENLGDDGRSEMTNLKSEGTFNDKTETSNNGLDRPTDVSCDPLCRDTEMDGNVLVVPDVYITRRGDKPDWVPVIKRDPFPVYEYLVLSLEEAFFLTYGLGCLVVYDLNNVVMGVTAMWQAFRLARDNFVYRYVAYHYFRSRGWVPKCGSKFGTHFLLYRDGPDFYHASFAVLVQPVRQDTLAPYDTSSDLDLSWISLMGLNRLSENVAKEVLICYVIIPDMDEATLQTPNCMKYITVQEVVTRRWISSQEREASS